jgi:hypothetical protein
MALVTCPECSRTISSLAATCPGCGCPIGAAGSDPQPKEEKVYLADGYVNVTSTWAAIGNHRYAIANISSVNSLTVPYNRQPFIMLGAFAAVVAISAFNLKAYWFCGLTAAAGTALLFAAFMGKDKYVLVITGGGSETRALETHNLAFIQSVLHAIQSAVSERR